MIARLQLEHIPLPGGHPALKPRRAASGGRASGGERAAELERILERITDPVARAVYREKVERGWIRLGYTEPHRPDDDRGGLW